MMVLTPIFPSVSHVHAASGTELIIKVKLHQTLSTDKIKHLDTGGWGGGQPDQTLFSREKSPHA